LPILEGTRASLWRADVTSDALGGRTASGLTQPGAAVALIGQTLTRPVDPARSAAVGRASRARYRHARCVQAGKALHTICVDAAGGAAPAPVAAETTASPRRS